MEVQHEADVLDFPVEKQQIVNKEQPELEIILLWRGDALSWALMPAVLSRIRDRATGPAEQLLENVSASFGAGSPSMFLLAFLRDGAVVGHALAYVIDDLEAGRAAWLHQAYMDEVDEVAAVQAFQLLKEWAGRLKLSKIRAASSSRWKAIMQKYGFEYRSAILELAIPQEG